LNFSSLEKFGGIYVKQDILEAVKKAKEESKPRNFTQSIDVVITIKDLDVKKPENRIDEEVLLPNGRGKDVKIAFIADGELALQAKNAGANMVINKGELEEMGKDRKGAKKIANRHDFFVAQADMMPLVGRFLGPVLGPRKKMPKPVPATAKPEPIMERLKSTVKVRIKDQPVIQALVGTQDMDDELIAANIDAVLAVLDQKLEKGRNQIKSMYVKTTMGPVVRVI
jgi:large subunit ribosomal protein L1